MQRSVLRWSFAGGAIAVAYLLATAVLFCTGGGCFSGQGWDLLPVAMLNPWLFMFGPLIGRVMTMLVGPHPSGMVMNIFIIAFQFLLGAVIGLIVGLVVAARKRAKKPTL